jgi:hypothetical protein
VIKFGGITIIISGLLFLAQYLFLLPIPGPPPGDMELMAWLQDWRFHFSMADELMVFAALSLLPPIVALYRILVKTDKIKAMLGCGLLAATVPVYLFLVIILGRLVYPVYDIELSPDAYRLVLTLYYGGQHLAALIWGAAVIVLCFVIRRSTMGKAVAYLGFAAGVLSLIGSYPWLIGNVMLFVTQLFSMVWLILLGIKILGQPEEA